jgi:hypothetical protein
MCAVVLHFAYGTRYVICDVSSHFMIDIYVSCSNIHNSGPLIILYDISFIYRYTAIQCIHFKNWGGLDINSTAFFFTLASRNWGTEWSVVPNRLQRSFVLRCASDGHMSRDQHWPKSKADTELNWQLVDADCCLWSSAFGCATLICNMCVLNKGIDTCIQVTFFECSSICHLLGA